MKKILPALLFFCSGVSAADIHFICNAKVFSTVNGMDKYEKSGKLDIYIKGDLVQITAPIIQPLTIYLKPTTDQWGIDHKISYDYSMPASYSDQSWDVGNILKDRRGIDPQKWWESDARFSLDKRYGQLRFRQYIFAGGSYFIQNVEGTCKDANKAGADSKWNFLEYFRF